MTYTTTITQSGQITLTKAAREALGVKNGDRVVIDLKKGKLVVEPRMSDEEFFAKLDAIVSPESRAREKEISKKYAGKSVREMLEDWEKSEEGQKFLKEEYGHR